MCCLSRSPAPTPRQPGRLGWPVGCARHMWPGALAGIVVSLVTMFAPSGLAADPAEEVRETLARQSFPWYDAQSDQLRRIDLPPKRRESTSSSSSSSRNTNSRQSQDSWEWGGSWSNFSRVMSWLFLGILIAVLVTLLVVLLIRWQRPHRPVVGTRLVGPPSTSDRADELPVPRAELPDDLRSAADRAAQEGDFRRAATLLYSHLLLTLDERHLIRLARGKTNRQYLRELRRATPSEKPGEAFARVLAAFESVFFGDLPMSRLGWEPFAQDVSLVERTAQRAP